MPYIPISQRPIGQKPQPSLTSVDTTEKINLGVGGAYFGIPTGETISATPKLTGWQAVKEKISNVFEPVANFLTGMQPRERANIETSRKFGEESAYGVSVKVPFVQLQIPLQRNILTQTAKGLIEWPETAVKDVTDTIKILKSGFQPLVKPPVTSQTYGKISVDSLYQQMDQMKQAALDAGMSETSATVVSSIYGISQGIFDMVFLGSLFKMAAQEVLKGTANSVLKKEAWEKLGMPSTMEEAKTNFYSLSHDLHPDMIGGNAEGFKLVNDAYGFLEKNGIPTVAERVSVPTIRQLAEQLLAPVGEKITAGAVPYAGKIAGQLPGYAPVSERGLIPMGLSIEEMKPVGKEIISKAKPILEKPRVSGKGVDNYFATDKPKTYVHEFIDENGKSSFTTGVVKNGENFQIVEKVKIGGFGETMQTKSFNTFNEAQTAIENAKISNLKQTGTNIKLFNEIESKLNQAVKGGKLELSKIYQQEFDKIQTAGEKKIFTDIRNLGGLKTDPTLIEEMSDLPINIMRKDGVMPDEMMKMLNDRGYRLKSISDMFDAIKSIRSMPTRFRTAESRLATVRSIKTKMPTPAGLTAEQLDRMERRLIKEATTGRGQPPKVTIEKKTGIRPLPEKKIEIAPSRVLKIKLRAEVKGATESAKATRGEILTQLREERTDIESVKKQITNYVKESLDVVDRGKANIIIRDAKDQRDIVEAFSRINRWAEDSEKKGLRNDIIKETKKALESPSVAIDYKERIRAIVDDFELKGHTEKTLADLEATKKYIDERIALGEDVEIPKRIWQSLRILSRKPFAEITLKELSGALDEIVRLEQLGKTKWDSIQQLYKYEQDSIKNELIASTRPITTIEKIMPKIGKKLNISQKAKNTIIGAINEFSRIDKVLMPIDVIADWLDGAKGTYTGPNSRLIKGRLDYKWNLYSDAKDSIQEPIIDLANKLKLKQENFEKIGFVAARDQEGGLERLKNLGYSEEEINKVTLTIDEQKILNEMRASFDKEFPGVVDVMRNIYNQPVGKVKNYFSFMTDWSKTDEIEVYQRMGPAAEEFGKPTKKVDMGFTITRTGPGMQKIKLNAMNIFMKHTDNVAYLKTMGRDIKMLYEIINSPEYGKAAGDLGQLMMLEWIDVVARKGGAAGAKVIPMLDMMRKNIGAGILGLKLTSAAIQWTSLLDGMGMIGPEWGMKGMASIATSREWRDFIMKFPELKQRAGGETAIRELIEGSAFRKIQAAGFIPLEEMDKLTACSVASGAYQKKMAELGKDIDLSKSPNKEAMEYSQLAVRRTQAIAQFKDVPLAVSRGAITGSTSFDRAMLQFQNFLLFRWSRIRYDAWKVGITTKNPIHAANVLLWILLGSMAAIGSRMGVYKVMDFITGKDQKKSTSPIVQLIYELTGTVPFLGNILGSYLYDNELVPIFNAPQQALQGAKSAINGKNLSTKAKGVSNFLTGLMMLGGIPGGAQLQQILRRVMGKAPTKGLQPPTKSSPKITPPPPMKGSLGPSTKSLAMEDVISNMIKQQVA